MKKETVYTVRYELENYDTGDVQTGVFNMERDGLIDSDSEEADFMNDVASAVCDDMGITNGANLAFSGDDSEYFNEDDTELEELMSPNGGYAVLDDGSDPEKCNLKIEVYCDDKLLDIDDLYEQTKGDGRSK